MCGIAGKFNFGQKPVTEAELKAMTDAIAHRGPDQAGFWTNNNIGFSFRRLAIIELSPAGNQPMSDAEGKIWIVFNGEIYNFQSLRAELEKDGVKFRSKGDTEVIIYAYKKYGVKCLEKLRGMFAFASWDENKKELFAARDRLGKKPFKYYVDKNTFIFASELKAILKCAEVKKEPDREAIANYLSFQYVPHPATGFVGIKKLPPAHYLRVQESGEIVTERYWNLDYREKWELSEKEWTEKIIDKLAEAVRLRMIADVPLGAFLSGGTDSSAIVALMSQFSSAPVKTFSIGFKEATHNELPYARLTAEKFKTDHHEFVVSPEAIKLLPKLIYHYEEPYADSSALPSWHVAEQTKQHVTVALNGDGGDENFAGYLRYNFYQLAHQHPIIAKLFGPLIAKLMLRPKWRQQKALKFLKRLREGAAPAQKYFPLIAYIDNYPNQALTSIEAKFEQALATDSLDQLLWADINSYLPDDLLVKIDIATMAHSLEGRSPLLDHEFMELTAKIPSSLKLKGNTNKYIFKRALKQILPAEILNRPKMGFSVPIDRWFRNGLLGYLKATLLAPKAIARSPLDAGEVNRLINSHASGQNDYANELWTLLTLELWYCQYID